MSPRRLARARAVVTDHALIRYMERVLRVDVDALRCEVLGIVEGGIERGAASVRRDGRSYVVDGGRIVTVLPKGAGPRRPAVVGRRGPSARRWRAEALPFNPDSGRDSGRIQAVIQVAIQALIKAARTDRSPSAFSLVQVLIQVPFNTDSVLAGEAEYTRYEIQPDKILAGWITDVCCGKVPSSFGDRAGPRHHPWRSRA